MDYLAVVKQKEEEEAALYARMQYDSNLLYLKQYVLSDAKNVAVPDIVNVTLNKPAVFFANVVSSLGAVSEQVNVETADEAIDTHEIEEFQTIAFQAANGLLRKRGLALLNVFADVQFCARGRTARKVLFQEVDGILVPEITCWDGRNIRFEKGKEGLLWVANKCKRTREQIESEYGVICRGKQGTVLDIWDDAHNEVWVDNKKVLEQQHDFGFTPVVVQTVALGYGSMILDADRIQNEGESIFFMIRHIAPELNRLVSILQTLNMKAVKPPMVIKTKEGKLAEPPEYEDVTDMGTITSLDVEGGIAPIDYGDAKRAAEMVYRMIEKAYQEGSYTDIDIGNPRQPFSAIALITIGESKDMVYLPRLAAKEALNNETAEMFTEQVLQIGGTIELGARGHKRKFNTRKLKGEYTTGYKYFIKSPQTDIARMSVAQAARAYYDPETILRDILQVEDWENVMQKKYYYMAESVFPNILQHRIIMKTLELAEDGDENAAMEAKMMALSLGQTIAQIKAGTLPPQYKPEPEPEPVVPLLGETGQIGGVTTSAKRSAELQATPQEPGGE